MTKIIGHRGAAGIALENSPASIKAALALPVEAIEIDARLTSDGQVVVIHDKHTGRVAGKKLFVSESTLAELKELTLNNGEKILTLDEALKMIGAKRPVVIDLKTPEVTALELAPLIKKHRRAKITLSSRNYPQLEKLHKELPDIPITARAYIYSTDIVHIARMMGAKGISVNKWVMNPLTYHLAERAGLYVHTYTVNHPWLVRLFSKLYPDICIITNYPDRYVDKGESNERSVRTRRKRGA